jgi:hypothetical protein
MKSWIGIKLWLTIMALITLSLSTACQGIATSTSPTSATPTLPTSPSPSTSPTPTTPYSRYQLAYVLLDKYPDFFWCDPDFYPVAREGQEQANAIAQYPAIRSNGLEFSAILERLNLPTQGDYSDSQKLDIYRQHKLITVAVQLTASAEGFRFSLAVGQGQGQRVTGMINAAGLISGLSQVTSFNTCPICLSQGTLIDTPHCQIAVESLQVGDVVWSVDSRGQRIAASIAKTPRTEVPPGFQVLRIELADGRSLAASPNHPSAQYKALGDYRIGELLDGGQIVNIEAESYQADFTYDLLPATGSGFYWADGILVGSTISR